MNTMGKIWFHSSKKEETIQWFHDNMQTTIHEYVWRQIDETCKEPAIHGWFRPSSVHALAEIRKHLPHVTILPALLDPTPNDPNIVKLLSYAGVTATDSGYVIAKKLHHHHVEKYGGDYPELHPSFY